jgi:zinc resistance-associated protein
MSNRFMVGTLAVFVVLGAVGAGSVLRSSDARAQGAPEQPNRPPFPREDAAAYLEARIAALRAGLLLNPEQERLWPPFEQAYREYGKQRLAGPSPGAPPNEDPIARMQRRADALLQQGAALKHLADAAIPLWQSFDEGQKRRFAVLARPLSARFGMAMGFGGPDGLPGGPGRDGRFGFDGPRGFGPGSPNFRFGPGFGPGGPGTTPGIGPRGRFGDDFRGPRGGDGGPNAEPRDGRDGGRDLGRGLFQWWRGGPGPGRGDPREGRGGEERL